MIEISSQVNTDCILRNRKSVMSRAAMKKVNWRREKSIPLTIQCGLRERGSNVNSKVNAVKKKSIDIMSKAYCSLVSMAGSKLTPHYRLQEQSKGIFFDLFPIVEK